MFAKPQAEHHWLDQLLGEWEFHHDCIMPDGSRSESNGVTTCRSLGGMWLILESTAESAEDSWTSIMTLGFDTEKKIYVGTFVASPMSSVWLYEGQLDEAGKCLTLNTRGPTFDGAASCDYRDAIDIADDRTWWLRSSMQTDEGSWVSFMNGKHTRR